MHEEKMALNECRHSQGHTRYPGHPPNAMKEEEAINKIKPNFRSVKAKPLINITGFTVYNKCKYLCPIDPDSTKRGTRVSGYLKIVGSDSDEINDSDVPVKSVGPFLKWFINDFDTENKISINLYTKFASYNFLAPHAEYASYMYDLKEKLWVRKAVVNFIQVTYSLGPTYTELLENISYHTIPDLKDQKISEEMLRKHAQYVCDQVVVLDKTLNKPFMDAPCMNELMNLTVDTLNAKTDYNKDDEKATMIATSTSNQLDTTNNVNSLENYNIAIINAHPTVADDKIPSAKKIKKIKWMGAQVIMYGNNLYFKRVKVEEEKFNVRDFVIVNTGKPHDSPLVARLTYMYHNIKKNESLFHAQIFIKAADTVLGEAGDPREVFLMDLCCHDVPLSLILRKAYVEKRDSSKDWYKLGRKAIAKEFLEDDGKTYFYQKFYNKSTGRFEDLPINPKKKKKPVFCPSCERLKYMHPKDIPKVSNVIMECPAELETPRTKYSTMQWQDIAFKEGSGVFLIPGTFKFVNDINHNAYGNSHTIELETPEPYCVGHIASVIVAHNMQPIKPEDIYLEVNILYRPENTACGFPHHEDPNVLYWSDEIKTVSFFDVEGLCQLAYVKNIPQGSSIYEWLEADPSRMYFEQSFDRATNKFGKVPKHAENVGKIKEDENENENEKDKNKKSSEPDLDKTTTVHVEPLRTLHVFAGCGGMSDGLRRSGAADCKWAIESDEAAAHAFSLNNECIVFNEDCNELLQDLLCGAIHSARGLLLPRQGEVELLCGSPPYRDYSEAKTTNFRNTLVASFLTYCDYYRPKYFILENDHNFVKFKKGMMLKHTLQALLDMGYQCTFGLMHDGNFGVPKATQRVIILAAAPGCLLPSYPEPTHVFDTYECSNSTKIDGKLYSTNTLWAVSAPRRSCTIYDAISDLPPIRNGADDIEIEYDSMPMTYYQCLARGDEVRKLRDHVCTYMPPMKHACINNIGPPPGFQWSDLPNLSITISDETKTRIVRIHEGWKAKKGTNNNGLNATSGECSPGNRQDFPLCLPYTVSGHNISGLTGRLEWNGYFGTTVTGPEPIVEQRRVMHPNQDRVLSVRECARLQGFCDTYRFEGSMLDKYKQVENAVSPPLAMALGKEIKKAMLNQKPREHFTAPMNYLKMTLMSNIENVRQHL